MGFAEEYYIDDERSSLRCQTCPLTLTRRSLALWLTLQTRKCSDEVRDRQVTTIVNAIVGAMSEGKKVLFVAEKMAALEVVAGSAPLIWMSSCSASSKF